MRVSNALKFLVLAIFALACFSLSPLIAGEHPWDENQISGDDPDTTIINTGGDNPDGDNPEDPNNPGYDLFGTPLFWLQIILDAPDGTDQTILTGADSDGAAIN